MHLSTHSLSHMLAESLADLLHSLIQSLICSLTHSLTRCPTHPTHSPTHIGHPSTLSLTPSLNQHPLQWVNVLGYVHAESGPGKITKSDGASLLHQCHHLGFLHGSHSAAHHTLASLAKPQEGLGVVPQEGSCQRSPLNDQPNIGPASRPAVKA